MPVDPNPALSVCVCLARWSSKHFDVSDAPAHTSVGRIQGLPAVQREIEQIIDNQRRGIQSYALADVRGVSNAHKHNTLRDTRTHSMHFEQSCIFSQISRRMNRRGGPGIRCHRQRSVGFEAATGTCIPSYILACPCHSQSCVRVVRCVQSIRSHHTVTPLRVSMCLGPDDMHGCLSSMAALASRVNSISIILIGFFRAAKTSSHDVPDHRCAAP